VIEGKYSTERFVVTVDQELATSVFESLIDGNPIPRPVSTANVFGIFDSRPFEPNMLSLDKLGKAGQTKL
jgi:hypothetical protein